jgi:uridine kinase
VLVAGLPRAGKSTLAERLCALNVGAEHLPLDKYFLPVPTGHSFSSWIQHPAALDWEMLGRHLQALRSGRDCFTPALDWKASGRRLNDGGDVPHPSSKLVRGGARFYVIPGCFAFEAPVGNAARAFKVFVETPLRILAERYSGESESELGVAAVVARHCPAHQRIQACAQISDLIVSGEVVDEAAARAAAMAMETFFSA